MLGSVNGVSGLIVSVTKQAETLQAVDVAVLKKGQNIDKANGEAALRLIESAKVVGRVDEYV